MYIFLLMFLINVESKSDVKVSFIKKHYKKMIAAGVVVVGIAASVYYVKNKIIRSHLDQKAKDAFITVTKNYIPKYEIINEKNYKIKLKDDWKKFMKSLELADQTQDDSLWLDIFDISMYNTSIGRFVLFENTTFMNDWPDEKVIDNIPKNKFFQYLYLYYQLYELALAWRSEFIKNVTLDENTEVEFIKMHFDIDFTKITTAHDNLLKKLRIRSDLSN